MGPLNTYFSDLAAGIQSTISGLWLTLLHLLDAGKKIEPKHIASESYFSQDKGIVTLEYPYEAIPVPDNGRYRLHNEIDDCIVCDKCAKICPVDCIDIVPIKSTEEIGVTSDGTSKRLYAATFDIDMAKCCFCGLCTTVCPTECLTMTSTFDFSEYDVRDMTYHFTDLSPEVAEEKRKLYEEKQAEKAAAAAKKQAIQDVPVTEVPSASKPAFKPKFPVVKQEAKDESTAEPTADAAPSGKPVFKPKIPSTKPVGEGMGTDGEAKETSPVAEGASTKPVFKPKIPVKKEESSTPDQVQTESVGGDEVKELATSPSKPVFKPKIPVPKKASDTEITKEAEEAAPPEISSEATATTSPNPKPVFKPKMKPIIPPKKDEPSSDSNP